MTALFILKDIIFFLRQKTANGDVKQNSKEMIYTRPGSPSDSEHSQPMSESHSIVTLQEETAYSVDYETRDGSAKHGRDYTSVKGTMVSFEI